MKTNEISFCLLIEKNGGMEAIVESSTPVHVVRYPHLTYWMLGLLLVSLVLHLSASLYDLCSQFFRIRNLQKWPFFHLYIYIRKLKHIQLIESWIYNYTRWNNKEIKYSLPSTSCIFFFISAICLKMEPRLVNSVPFSTSILLLYFFKLRCFAGKYVTRPVAALIENYKEICLTTFFGNTRLIQSFVVSWRFVSIC